MENNSSSMTMGGMVDNNSNYDNSNSSMNMDSMDMSSSTMGNMDGKGRNYSLVDMTDYQSAHNSFNHNQNNKDLHLEFQELTLLLQLPKQ